MPPSRTSSRSIAGSSKSHPGPGSLSGITSNPSKGGPRSRPRFPRTALRILEGWTSVHRQSPYPTPSDVDHLSAETGLKRSQVSNWFANVRKRGKVPKPEKDPFPSEKDERTLTAPPSSDDVPLFHRWLNSWTEHEAAALPAILEAVSQLKGACSGSFLRGSTRYHREFCPSESSLSSMEIRSYVTNVESVYSEEWRSEHVITTTLVPSVRRHRRLPAKISNYSCSENQDDDYPSKKFQCTFCTDRFRTKYDWQRHEKSIHLPLEKWTCSPSGSIDVNPITNEITCVFCGDIDPDPEHIAAHGYTACVSRPISERTFYRKDHLRQHLRLMHRNCAFAPSMEFWKTVTNSIRSRCGFCDDTFSTWSDRVDHLAEHFSDGFSVAENWKGDWGFDDEISTVLEKASLPGKDQEVALLTAPNSMMDDSYADSLCLQSFLCDAATFTDSPAFEFEDVTLGNIWEGSLDLPTGFFNLDFNHVESSGSAPNESPFIVPPGGFVDDNACKGLETFDGTGDYHGFQFYEDLQCDVLPGFTSQGKEKHL